MNMIILNTTTDMRNLMICTNDAHLVIQNRLEVEVVVLVVVGVGVLVLAVTIKCPNILMVDPIDVTVRQWVEVTIVGHLRRRPLTAVRQVDICKLF